MSIRNLVLDGANPDSEDFYMNGRRITQMWLNGVCVWDIQEETIKIPDSLRIENAIEYVQYGEKYTWDTIKVYAVYKDGSEEDVTDKCIYPEIEYPADKYIASEDIYASGAYYPVKNEYILARIRYYYGSSENEYLQYQLSITLVRYNFVLGLYFNPNTSTLPSYPTSRIEAYLCDFCDAFESAVFEPNLYCTEGISESPKYVETRELLDTIKNIVYSYRRNYYYIMQIIFNKLNGKTVNIKGLPVKNDRSNQNVALKQSIDYLTIADTCEVIDDYAFNECINLETLSTIPLSVKKIGAYAFYNTKLKSVTIPENCEISSTSFPDGCIVTRYAREQDLH